MGQCTCVIATADSARQRSGSSDRFFTWRWPQVKHHTVYLFPNLFRQQTYVVDDALLDLPPLVVIVGVPSILRTFS